MLDKVASGQEAHGAPPGFYLLLFWVTFWPGAVLAGLAAPIVWKSRHEPRIRFLLAWLLPSWLVFEAVMTQVAALRAAFVSRHCHHDCRHSQVLRPDEAALDGARDDRLVSSARSHRSRDAGAVHCIRSGPRADRLAVCCARRDLWIVCVVAFTKWTAPNAALLRAMVASVFVAVTVYAVTFPLLPSLFSSALIAGEIKAGGSTRPHVASTFAYQEPSLVFLLGTETRFSPTERALPISCRRDHASSR